MDYDYGHSERQFEGNVVSYDAGEEQEDYEDTHHHHHHRQQQREDEIGSGGNERHQSFNIRDSSSSSSSSAGKLFVGGLSWDTTEETFSSYFSKYGEITDAVIMIDRNTGRPRGFGFITFADPAAAERALEDEHVIDGRTVEVKRTVPKGDMERKGVVRAKKIFIGGIPPSLTEDDLNEYFSSYGSIVDHQIMLDHKTGRSRGFGFVTFENEDAVERIFMEDKIHELGGKQVEIKKAEPKRPGGGSVGGGGDYGSASKSYGGFNNRSSGYGPSHGSANQYGGKMGRGYEGYGSYNAYGGYGGSYAGNAAGFYGGYGGGYGFGYGYGGPMMYGAGGYGGSGYGNPSAYGSNAGYSGGKAYGKNGDNGNFGAGKGYGYGNAVGGGYGAGSNGGGSGSGGGGGGSAPGRYHPYRK